MGISQNIKKIREELPTGVTLVAVSKTKPTEHILEAYSAGQRAFGENYVQELVEKQSQLPSDIDWHFIGHLQSNKIKYIGHFVSLIHGVDNENLLSAINKHGAKINRVIPVLLQVFIATEETKFGFTRNELNSFLQSHPIKEYPFVQFRGLMGMASFTDNTAQINSEFSVLKNLFDDLKHTIFHSANEFDTLSMGMSGDWKIAVAHGSNLVRIGSSIFGER